MEIYECILSLIGGIGAFMIAMELLTKSLNELAGEKMKLILKKITVNRIMGVIFGTVVTAVIQSSAATTIMVIGFVNAKGMDLYQASAIIIGANIGTTATGFLSSLDSLNVEKTSKREKKSKKELHSEKNEKQSQKNEDSSNHINISNNI